MQITSLLRFALQTGGKLGGTACEILTQFDERRTAKDPINGRIDPICRRS
jgi:hypothetical protein